MNNNQQKVTVELSGGEFRLMGGSSADNLNPKALMLCATAMCAGKTIMALLSKQKIQPKRLEITVEGTLNTPTLRGDSVYESFEVIYNAECHTLSEQETVAWAIESAQEKYCGMVTMLRKIAPVSQVIEVVSTES